jgi:hypothetical protein
LKKIILLEKFFDTPTAIKIFQIINISYLTLQIIEYFSPAEQQWMLLYKTGNINILSFHSFLNFKSATQASSFDKHKSNISSKKNKTKWRLFSFYITLNNTEKYFNDFGLDTYT